MFSHVETKQRGLTHLFSLIYRYDSLTSKIAVDLDALSAEYFAVVSLCESCRIVKQSTLWGVRLLPEFGSFGFCVLMQEIC